MRKFASLAALTLCAGTTMVAGASAASAAINIGNIGDDPNGTATAPAAGSLDFAKNWCGAPWLWSAQPSGTDCAAQHGDAAGQ